MMPARLVVALEPDEDSLSLVEGYARLAAELRRELVALLMEDTGFTQALALPFARLQPRMSAAHADIGPSTARHALRVFRGRVESRLDQACRRLEVRWQLSVAGALPEPAAGDIMVFGPRGPRPGMAAPAACPVVLLRRAGHGMVVLYEGTADTLTLAEAGGTPERLPVTVLAWAEDATKAARFAGEAAAIFGHDAVMALVDDGGSPLAILAGLRPRAVVVDACNASIRLTAILDALAR